eukprot:2219115-Amphidinium_carterae.1
MEHVVSRQRGRDKDRDRSERRKDCHTCIKHLINLYSASTSLPQGSCAWASGKQVPGGQQR